MKILAFDQALTTGWAVLNNDSIETTGTFEESNDGTLPELLEAIWHHTDSLLSEHQPNIVAVESVHANRFNPRTGILLAGVQATIILVANVYVGVKNVIEITPAECNATYGVTKGKKRKERRQTLMRMREDLPGDLSEHELDAIAIAEVTHAKLKVKRLEGQG
jgi:Holliday junction resolvasome RuvABC endonuclease subunit